jgi:hypothetical protein
MVTFYGFYIRYWGDTCGGVRVLISKALCSRGRPNRGSPLKFGAAYSTDASRAGNMLCIPFYDKKLYFPANVEMVYFVEYIQYLTGIF